MSSHHLTISQFSIALLAATGVTAFENCRLQGPSFPAPAQLSNSPIIRNATFTLSSLLNQTITSSNSTYGRFDSANTTYSLEIFSLHSTAPLLTKHHSSTVLAASKVGVKSVNSKSIYRIGSLTKLFAAYTALIAAGDTKWNDAVTKYVPELEAASRVYNASENPIDHVAWTQITLGDLASHIADVGRDLGGFRELTGPLSQIPDPTIYGLPPLNASDLPSCAGGGFCTRKTFFAGFTKRHPVYAPATAAIYSNVAYQILSYAIENITGVDFPTLVETKLYKPLNLSASSWRRPPASNASAVISNPTVFSLDLGDETVVGGMYSTLNDVVTIGRSILNSTLLPSVTTRRWMRPHSFSSSLTYSIGAPWEITRLTLPNSTEIVDMYTKTGDVPGYASFLVLIPAWNIGWTVLAAGVQPSTGIAIISNQITDVFLPAVAIAARQEASVNFAGKYSSSIANLTVETSSDLPGLGITSWFNNGTNLLTSPAAGPSIRLYPTNLERKLANGDKEIAFRAVYENPKAVRVGGVFSQECFAWANVDLTTYGSIGNDEFVFVVGKDGKAKSIKPRAYRAEMKRIAQVA